MAFANMERRYSINRMSREQATQAVVAWSEVIARLDAEIGSRENEQSKSGACRYRATLRELRDMLQVALDDRG